MHYVVLGTHSADVCPTSNAATRALLGEIGPQIPKIAEAHRVTILAGPLNNREHVSVLVVQGDRAEDLDAFLAETRLPQWNSIRILPSLTMEESMRELETHATIF